MLLLLYIVAVAGAVVVSQQSELSGRIIYDLDEAETLFEEFIKTYEKEYENETEKLRRLEIFKENLRKVNERHMMPEESAVFGITKFMDLTFEEHKSRYNGLQLNDPHCPDCTGVIPEEFVDPIPESFDWRDENKVTPVKDQGYCSSCWAFSVIGTVESSYAIKHNDLQTFSEQQLVDCNLSDRSFGCASGCMPDGIKYLEKIGGSMTEASYPYKAKDDKCKFDKSKVKAKVIGCLNVNGTEEQLKAQLHKYGPVSIGVASEGWSIYHGGIMSLNDCPSDGHLDHAVLLTGYGTEHGKPYWRIKNSQGTTWGENGYIRIERGKNVCRLMNSPHSIAVVE